MRGGAELKFINRAKKLINRLRGQIHIPEEIYNNNEKKLLHISDTPDCIYHNMFNMIEDLDPDIIIHTGDLVDNIKLGNGAPLNRYSRGLEELLIFLKKKKDKDIYIVPGNHDSVEILGRKTEHIKLIEEGSILNIEGHDFGLAHYRGRLPLNSKINLYGHNKEIYNKEGKLFLNGLLNINIVLIPSIKVIKLSYPLITDNARKYKNMRLP